APIDTLIFVEKNPHRRLSAGPDIALEVAERHDVEPIERDAAVTALSYVPDQDAVAFAERRWLGEFARTGDVALADVEPVTLGLPLRNVCHHGSPRLRTMRALV